MVIEYLRFRLMQDMAAKYPELKRNAEEMVNALTDYEVSQIWAEMVDLYKQETSFIHN